MAEKQPMVYVIDDDEKICDALEWLISSINYRVQTFPSADAFLQSAEPETPG